MNAGVFSGYTAQKGQAAYLRLHSKATGQDLNPESECSAEGQVAPMRRTEVHRGRWEPWRTLGQGSRAVLMRRVDGGEGQGIGCKVEVLCGAPRVNSELTWVRQTR